MTELLEFIAYPKELRTFRKPSAWDIIDWGGWPEPEPEPCPGDGKCHGCLVWCDWCGDVGNVCHIKKWPGRCDQHERYPVRPEPDLNQLMLPGMS